MKDHRNIYQARNTEASPGPPPPTVNPGLGEMQRRARLTTTLLALFMLVLLGLAIWLIREQDRKLQREEPSAQPEVQPAIPLPSASDLGAPAPAQQPAIPQSALSEVLAPQTSPPPQAVSTLTPEQSAQAMTELRTAQEYLRGQDLENAEIHTRRALEIWPQWNLAKQILGLIYTQRGQFEQAITLLEQVIAENPMSIESVNTLATAYMQKGWMGRAEELLHSAEVMNPDYWPAQLNLGLLYLLKKQYDAAAGYLEPAIERVPNDPGPRNNLGVALLRLGRFDDARRHFQILIDQHPDSPAPYFNMAIGFVLQKDFDTAVEWIRRGSEHCTPMTAQQWLADQAFNPLRLYGPFQQIMSTFAPDLTEPPP